mgnify:CR=1 FL=1
MTFVWMLVDLCRRLPLGASRTSRSGRPDDEADRRAIGATLHVGLIGQALHEGHPQAELVTEALGGLHVGQVRYGVGIEPRTVIDHLDQHVVVGYPTADNDPVPCTDRTLGLDGIGSGLGHDETEIGHPSGLQR